MKIVVIAVMALLILGGGGAGAYFYFKQPAEAATDPTAKTADADAEKKKKEKEKAEPTAFVQLDPLVLPVIGKDGLTETVSMVIVIETQSEATKAEVAHMAPKLKDAFIQDMYGSLTKDTVMKGGVIQVGALKSRLHGIGVKVLGEDMVKDVLLQVVQQRPI